MKQTICIILLLTTVIIIPINTFGQEEEIVDEEKMGKYHRLDASYILGSQIYNDNLLYNPGYGFSLSNGVLINKNISLGIGVSGQFFNDEKFMPIYLDIIAYKKAKKSKKTTSFISTQVGYSVGWNTALTKLETYNYNGGAFISAGMGRKAIVNDDLSMLFKVAYQHQFALLSYKVNGINNYSETLNYDMLVLTISLLLEK